MMEEDGYVLDFLPLGRADDMRREPIAYVVGEQFFTLLEVVIKKDKEIRIGNKIYIGKNLSDRKEVDRVKNRISFEQLTSSAKSELKNVIKKIVIDRGKDFVSFFNKCGPITIRQHQLEILPGIGKKHLNEILAEREKKPFESFEDMSKRVSHFPDPAEVVAERIIEELKGSRYYIFTRPPSYSGPERRF